MTDKTAPSGTKTRAAARGSSGTRARARTERPPRCGHPKSENGHPCRRAAGGGTDHPGVGPCAVHDDGSWTRPAFAENVEARAAFLAAVKTDRLAGIRELVEALGYRKRDVTALIDADPEFQDDYAEARGFDPDRIRAEIADRALDRNDPASARLLELEAKMRLPEGQALAQRMRVDGRIEVHAIVASPEWVGLRNRVLGALRPFPEALDAVLAALASAEPEQLVVEGESRELAS